MAEDVDFISARICWCSRLAPAEFPMTGSNFFMILPMIRADSDTRKRH
jgi:hypothetical protein